MTPLSIIIPVYNSGESIRDVLAEVRGALPDRALQFVLVNDGSTDQSPRVIDELAAASSDVLALHLSRNFGQHNALLCGIRAAIHPLILTLDDDGQHPATEIPRMLAALDEETDVVYGVPAEERHSGWRVLASLATKVALGTVMGASAARHTSAFRLFRTELRDAFADFHSPNVVIDVLLGWTTTRFGHIAVEHRPRSRGESTYTLRKLLRHAINMLTGFTALPLRLASILGLAVGAFGFLLMLHVMVRAIFFNIAVPGFAFTICAITLFSGVQLLCLGIIGEYMARMHFRTMNRPAYCVRRQSPAARPDAA